MRFCKSHWEKLKAAITHAGIFHLVAQNGKEAADSAVRQLEGAADPVNDFDPLMNAYWAIVNNCLNNGGLYLMGADENGDEYCPLCELAKNYSVDLVHTWIGYAVKEQLEAARELKLVPKLQ